jgi:hypothetical protein
MIIWNAFLEIEFVEQPILSTNRWPHHLYSPTLTTSGQGMILQPSSSTASANSGNAASDCGDRTS